MATVTTASASGGLTPQTTDDPAPNGTTLTSPDEHQSSTDSSSASVRGCATASVGLGKRRWKASVRSVRWAPWEWNARSHVSVEQKSASASGTVTLGGRRTASANDGTGCGVIDTPNRFERCSARSARSASDGSSDSNPHAQNDRRSATVADTTVPT